MRASLFVATVLVTLTAVAAVASAQAVPAAPSHPASPRAPRSISVTISPLHLLSPILEVTGELAAGARLGIAALGGIGGSSATTGNNDTVRLFALEVGASVRY